MTSPSETLSPELAAIQAEAAATEPAPAPAPGEEGAAATEAPKEYLTDAVGLTNIVAESLISFYPSTEKVLGEDRRQKFAAALAPVMEKYGLDLAAIFGRWGAEINLAFVTAQFAVPLVRAIAEDRAAAKAAKENKPAAQTASVQAGAGLQPVVDVADPNSLHHKA